MSYTITCNLHRPCVMLYFVIVLLANYEALLKVLYIHGLAFVQNLKLLVTQLLTFASSLIKELVLGHA